MSFFFFSDISDLGRESSKKGYVISASLFLHTFGDQGKGASSESWETKRNLT